MRSLYLDIFSGISGDMFIGAMLDLGVEFRELDRELRKLGLNGYHLHVARKHKSSIEGVKFDVHLEGEDCGHGHDHGHGEERTFAIIRQLIEASTLSDWVKAKSIAVFHRVAVAEGKVHGLPPESVHFHEVGAVDSIVDIVGAAICLELLGKPHITSAPVVEGTGFVNCAHGRFPIPTTATLEILGARGIGVSQCEEPHELVTPTGAAILAEFVESFGPMGSVKAQRIGYGLGTRNNKTRPNVLRAILSETSEVSAPHDWLTDQVAVLETNLDDISGEILGHVLEKAFRLGALDAFHTPIQMKKQRPGVLLTVLCEPDNADLFTEFLLVETTAFGVRRTLAQRRKLQRDHIAVKTPYGTVQVKRGLLNGKVVQAAPEYESCKGVAAMAGVPVKEVFEAARRLLP
ncbi:MAG: hypothetical protein RLZZ582_15 [Verrucomicrobiota bacterium]